VKKIMVLIVMLFFSIGCFVSGDEPIPEPIGEQPVIEAVSEEIPASAVIETEKAEEIASEDAVESSKSGSTGISFGKGIWTFLNSSLGVSIVVFVLSFILGKIFTAKPKWKALMLKYGPSLMQAVKTAEKNIPDDTDNKGLARLDAALGYLIALEPKLEKVAEADVKQALSAVHAAAESNGNLK